jgi:hypothetical protein
VRKDVIIPAALVVVVVIVAIVGYQLSLRAGRDDQARVSPTPTPLQTSTASPSPTPLPPTATPTPAARTPEEFADRLGAALEASDWAAIEKLISPVGWNAGWWASEGTPSLSPAEAVAWLRQGTEDGRLAVTVDERPIRTRSDGSPPYVTSVWRNFDSRSGGRRPSQNAWLDFRQHTDGNWYWQTAIYNPLAIPGGP